MVDTNAHLARDNDKKKQYFKDWFHNTWKIYSQYLSASYGLLNALVLDATRWKLITLQGHKKLHNQVPTKTVQEQWG